MKSTLFILVVLLVGCAPIPTMEELEQQASASGDWSEVERRERIDRMRSDDVHLTCPDGYMRVCNKETARSICECVPTR